MVYIDDDFNPLAEPSIMPEHLYVRLDADLKDWLSNYVKNRGKPFTYNYIIINLLRYFRSASPEEQSAMMGMQLPAVASVGRLAEIMAWADHAFRAKRWEWALETYYKLLEESRDALGYQRIAHYKIGFCWLELALDLRQGARTTPSGSPEWIKHYEDADQAVQASLIHGSQFHELGGHHPTVWFNKACAWALHALFPIEVALKGGMDLVRDLRTASDDEWVEFAEGWRRNLDAATVAELDKKFDFCIGEAISNLNIMVVKHESVNGDFEDNFIAPTDPSFLVRLAETDPDLAVLRTDTRYRKKLLKWLTDNRPDMSMIHSFKNLRHHLSWDSPPDYFRVL